MRTKEEITTEVNRKIEEATPIVEELLKKYGKIRRTLTAEENIAYNRILFHDSAGELTSHLIHMRATFENANELKKFNKETRRAIQKEVDRTLGCPSFLGKIKNGKLVWKATVEEVDRVFWNRIEEEREIMQVFAREGLSKKKNG